jgi:hypothetical protein
VEFCGRKCFTTVVQGTHHWALLRWAKSIEFTPYHIVEADANEVAEESLAALRRFRDRTMGNSFQNAEVDWTGQAEKMEPYVGHTGDRHEWVIVLTRSC